MKKNCAIVTLPLVFWFIAIMFLGPSATAVNAGDMKSTTVNAGSLEIVKITDDRYEIKLNGHTVHTIEDLFVQIESVFHNISGADVVVLWRSAGGRGDEQYVVLDITPAGKVTATQTFGSGAGASAKQEGKKVVFSFVDGGKWVYQNHTLRKIKAHKYDEKMFWPAAAQQKGGRP